MIETLINELDELTKRVNAIKNEIWGISIERNKITHREFCNIFFKIIQDDECSHVEAYARTEVWHIEQYGHRRYKNYKSFKVIKSIRARQHHY